MSPISHQTIRLSKGKHASPTEGACVMELASMLAGEPFSDHPRSVCPVIGSVLRAYNDSIDDDRRQDLYAFAAKVVGSSAGPEAVLERAQYLRRWSRAQRRRRRRFSLGSAMRALAGDGRQSIELVGPRALRAIPRSSDENHSAVLELIDDLLAIERPGMPTSLTAATTGVRQDCHDTNGSAPSLTGQG